jgi:hypothetical protein
LYAYSDFTDKIERFHTPNQVEHGIISDSFNYIGLKLDELAGYLSGKVHDPECVLMLFVTFVTAQYMPYYSINYINYNSIHFTASGESADIIRYLLKKTRAQTDKFQMNTTTAIVENRGAQFTEVKCEIGLQSMTNCYGVGSSYYCLNP